MKKTKLIERIENARNAFFELNDEKDSETLVSAYGSHALENTECAAFSEKAGPWMNIARQVFLFLPGAFLLFFTPLAVTFFAPQIGFSLQMLFWLLTGTFSCLIGLGSLRNTKNLLIPFSIILFSAVLGILFSLFPGNLQAALYFEYSIYLFPFVLAGSKVLKDSIDDK